MNDISNTLLSLSLSGSVVALVLFVMKVFVRDRFSKFWQYYVWFVVLLRLLLPLALKTNIIGSIFQTPDDFTPKFNIHSLLNANAGLKVVLPHYLWILWLCGFVVMMIIRLREFVNFRKVIRASYVLNTDIETIAVFNDCYNMMNIRKNITLYKSPMITTPLIMNVVNPVLVLPVRTFSEKELRYAFLHELTHLKRKDLWYKWFVQFLACIHWFNPIIHLVSHEINRACELSCDEAVIKNLDIKGKREYGEMLISIASESRLPVGVLSTTMCEEKKSLKERLRSIMKYKGKTHFSIVLSAVFLFAIVSLAMLVGAVIN